MEWHHLIIALIVIAGYVIKHIVSTQQEAAAQREREVAARDKVGGTLMTAQQEAAVKRERLTGGSQPVVDASSDNEVASARTAQDRRIEEAVERRREREETGEEEKPVVVTRIPRHIPMTLPNVVVGPVPRYQPPAHDRAQPEVRQIPRSELRRAVPPTTPKTAAVAKAVPAAGRLKANVAAVANTMQLVAEAPFSAAPSAGPALRQALELLKDRQSLTTAFVLREILDRPVSMRRRRR
jgi:hypothetical protein